jgi:SpoVK/Ycf46/Vps4 family AAA+-type ATPase
MAMAMAKADQLKALIRTHGEGDDERFYAVALQMAAQAARQGQVKFAQELRDIVDEARLHHKSISSLRTRPVPIVQPRGELAGLIMAAYPKTRVSDMALEHSVEAQIRRVLLEQRRRARIREHGLAPIRKLLLVGPPGTGKTMTASALAGELGLPLFTIQLDGLITKFLGESASKLRLIFDAIRETRAVYLFDEFDAIGSKRATKNEVGEMRRILNSFLQFLEVDESESLIVAATNHPELLDRALLRRFESVITYGLPAPSILMEFLRSRLSSFDVSHVEWNQVASAAIDLSQADLARASEQIAKNALLEDRRNISTNEICSALDERRAAHF